MVLNEEQGIKELRDKRIAYGISQGRLAVASGITREYLNKIESGKMKPSKELMNVVLGEGERTMCELMHALETGKDITEIPGIMYKQGNQYVTTESRPLIANVSEIAYPSYEGFGVDLLFKDLNNYDESSHYDYETVRSPRVLPILFGRSCPYECKFCFHTIGRKYRVRTLDVILMVFVLALLCAWLYTAYITRPIVRLSKISKQMAELDFSGQCDIAREDELGCLAQNLNSLSTSLSTALNDLQIANQQLTTDIEKEQALEQQRVDFFSAASHELKTPLTILEGHLTGMLNGVRGYENHTEYMERSLAVVDSYNFYKARSYL